MSTEQGSAAGPECIAVPTSTCPRAAQLQLLGLAPALVKELHSFGLLAVAGNSAHGSVSDGRDRPPSGTFSYLYFLGLKICASKLEGVETRRELRLPRPVVVQIHCWVGQSQRHPSRAASSLVSRINWLQFELPHRFPGICLMVEGHKLTINALPPHHHFLHTPPPPPPGTHMEFY